jgi:bacterioferritin-associated ferredoxin
MQRTRGTPANFAIARHSHICHERWSCLRERQAVYVCLCNALTDRRLKQAANATGSHRPSELYAACGCRAQCGQCVHAVLKLLRDQAQQMEEQLQGAD